MIWRAHYLSGSILGSTPGQLGFARITDVDLPRLVGFEILDPVRLRLDANDRLVCFARRAAVQGPGLTVADRYFVQPTGREVYVISGASYRVMPGWGEGIDGPPSQLPLRRT